MSEAGELFGERIFGREGWTDRIVAVLALYTLPESPGEYYEFFDVPAGVMEHVGAIVAEKISTGEVTLPDTYLIEPLADGRLLGEGARYSGRLFPSSRGDERIEITRIEIEDEFGSVAVIEFDHKW